MPETYNTGSKRAVFLLFSAWTGDELLTSNDHGTILDALIPAQNKYRELGLQFKIQQHVIDGYFISYHHPQTCLYYVLGEFLNQTNPKPCWRVIIDALKSPSVKLHQLARVLEAKYLVKITPPVYQDSRKVLLAFLDNYFSTL